MNRHLQPGDLCTVIACACLTGKGRQLIGRQCTLRLPAPMGEQRHPEHGTFVVRFQDGHETVLCAACLRKTPPQALGSWRAIGDATGWTPAGTAPETSSPAEKAAMRLR